MKDFGENSILGELRLTNIAMHRGMFKSGDGCRHKPTMADHVVHFVYRSGGSVMQKEVESEFHLRRSSVSQLLKKLEEGGYIERTSEGGKMKRITLSSKAMLEQEEIALHIQTFEDRVECLLTAEEKQTFCTLMRKIREGFGANS